MKIFKKSVLAISTLMMGFALAACSDACDYLGADTNNRAFGEEHPASVANTVWVRTAGIKTNAYGEDVQGFVESIDFYREDSCVVKMSEPQFPANFSSSIITWVDESNTASTPRYEYTYSDITGKIEILKEVKDDKNRVSKTVIFSGVAAGNVVTIAHFGDTPVQTYLTKK